MAKTTGVGADSRPTGDAEEAGICPPRYNAATEKALEEAHLIIAGKIPAEAFGSAQEMLSALGR